MKLSEALHAASATLFPKIDGERQPDYKGLFVHTVSSILDARKVKYDAATVQKIADHINLSSFQRASAAEAAKRYGPSDLSGGARMAPIKAEPKAKKTGVRAIDGAPAPKKDPITGEARRPSVAAAKGKKAQSAAKDKATAQSPKEKRASEAKTVEAEKKAAPKVDASVAKKAERAAKDKARRAKGKPADIDPITGEAAV